MKLPGLLPVSLLFLAAVLAALIPVVREVNFGAIKEWQVLIGFTGTIIAGWVAWLNVGRQVRTQRSVLRMNLLSREEDRLESELVELQNAISMIRRLASDLSTATEVEHCRAAFESEKLKLAAGGRIRGALKELLPELNEEMLRTIGIPLSLSLRRLRSLEILNTEVKEARLVAANSYHPKQINDAQKLADDRREQLQLEVTTYRLQTKTSFLGVQNVIRTRISTIERLLKSVRAEIERYFAA